MKARLLLAVVLVLFGVAALEAKSLRLSSDILPRKQLAGPPSEFKQLPQTSSGAQDAQSAFFQITLSAAYASNTKDVAFMQPLPVDSSSSFSFSMFSPYASALELSLLDPKGNKVNLTQYATESSFPVGDSGNSVPSTTYTFNSPIVGVWNLMGTVNAQVHRSHKATVSASAADLVVLLWNSNDVKMYSQLNTYSMLVGQPVGMNACVFNVTAQPSGWTKRLGRPEPLRAAVQFAELNVLFPDGVQKDYAMHDDGMHSDGLANDGIFGAEFKPSLAGQYWAQAFVRGKNLVTGAEYIRTSQHILRVMPDAVQLQPASNAKVSSEGTSLQFDIDVKYTETDVPDELIAYAEVWGTSASASASASSSSLVPIAWIGGAVDVSDSKGSPHVSLSLDTRWLSLANASAPFELRNVYLQNQLIPVSQLAAIPVTTSAQTKRQIAHDKLPARPVSILREMRTGKPPAILKKRAALAASLRNSSSPSVSTPAHALLLVHGYCAVIQPFENQFAVFTNGVLFEDFEQSRTNDAFAQRIAAFADSEGFASFGIVSHSQGGLAMLHLHAYYWTNLELAQGNRLLQSIGSPYQGSAIAGSSANLGKVFGVGCGENFDLTHDGAALWLNGINSTAALDDVYYYTTQYQTGSLVNYCSLPTNLILSWPNDGVTEADYAPLPNNAGHSMGHTKGECHTTNMQWPPQCWNQSRDENINENAAR